MATLRLEGEMTIGEAAALREQLLGALPTDDGGHLALDLSGVQAVDSTGVQLLLATHRLAAERGMALQLEAPTDSVVQALATYGLTAAGLQLTERQA